MLHIEKNPFAAKNEAEYGEYRVQPTACLHSDFQSGLATLWWPRAFLQVPQVELCTHC